MTKVVALRTKVELTAEQRVAEFIALAQGQLTNLIPTAAWSADAWDVSAAFVRKGNPRAASRLYFYQHGTLVGRGDKATGTPFQTAFRDFAKAYIRYAHSAAPKVFERLQARLSALRHIEAAFRALNMEPSIHLLAPDVLTKAVQIGTGDVTPAVKYQRGVAIELAYNLCLRQHLLASSFVWRHGIPKPQDPGERIGAEFEGRRAEKLPSRRAFEVLAHVYCRPRNQRDELLSAVCLICICAPWRASEVLQLRTDCEVTEKRRQGKREVPAYGLRAFPGKANKPQIKWIPDIAVDQAEEAIRRLRVRCAEAREIAAWYVRNPDRVYLPADLAHLRKVEWLTADQVAELANQTNGIQWAKRVGLEPRVGAGGRHEYRFADLERAVLAQLPRDFPYQNGLRTHQYDEALILVRQGALRAGTGGRGSRVMFESIDVNQFNRWLSGTPEHSTVFQQYGFTEEDGSQIKLTTHAFRHWNNHIGHKKGLSQEDIALWSGRDPGQNKYYDHQTAAEFQADLLDMARKAGGIGPVFEAADSIPEGELISREEFLREQIGSSHATEVGACFHDYALQPCQNHGDCITCEENGFIKGDPQHRIEIAKLLGVTEMQLAAATAAMAEEDYGADIWVQEHERKVSRLRVMLAKHDDIGIPDGTVVTLPADRQDSEIERAMRLRGDRGRRG
ncbi:hypothetical protein [Teichococcus aestuarii]|uniref:Integrase n=1 Tax=Teichococcus aestuarii TaxID=568898 RepID=A0A2U1V0M1_9PROT|nr:hypothetical protein [Pseudoroseomonas aestuarii]PWC27411.1 hypothetical protein CR165_18385 [Pseudoroseomonas aestuarii]